MIQLNCWIIFTVIAYDSVFGSAYRRDAPIFSSFRRGSANRRESVSPIFSSFRRTDHSDKKTYHFSRLDQLERINDPIVYEDGNDNNDKMVVAFNNMVVFGYLENDKHFVIHVNEDILEDAENIPTQFWNNNDSGELFDIVTMKPTTTTTTARTTTRARTTTTARTPPTSFPRYDNVYCQYVACPTPSTTPHPDDPRLTGRVWFSGKYSDLDPNIKSSIKQWQQLTKMIENIRNRTRPISESEFSSLQI